MWKPIVLLICSNLFMTAAWYGHLKFKSTALWTVILVSWGIAFFEYCLQVPANRIGSGVFYGHAAESNAGSHHPGRVYGVFRFVFS